MQLGTNCEVEIDETTEEIVIRIKAKQRHGPSGSGKTIIVASSGGPTQLTNGVTLNLNAWVKK